MKFKVVVEKDPESGGYVVSCPALPGCHSQGESVQEALKNIKEAIQGSVESLNSDLGKTRGARVAVVTV